jgi:hypothetical protein
MVRAAFGDAIKELTDAGIPLDAPLGEHQYVDWGGSRIQPQALGARAFL